MDGYHLAMTVLLCEAKNNVAHVWRRGGLFLNLETPGLEEEYSVE